MVGNLVFAKLSFCGSCISIAGGDGSGRSGGFQTKQRAKVNKTRTIIIIANKSIIKPECCLGIAREHRGSDAVICRFSRNEPHRDVL